MTIKEWLHHRTGRIEAQWRAKIRDRDRRQGEERADLLGHFLHTLPLLLLSCFGENRQAGEEAWKQATHLFGALALLRGLSAGEVVEELQLLRIVLLRMSFEDPPGDLASPVVQNEILRLNRVLDQGVVEANVAYVDDFFFAQFQGSGVPGGVTPEVEHEMGRQLDALGRGLVE